jgi:hypothetical protein
MTTTFERVKLSGSTDGRPILINSEDYLTPITIHTAASGTTSWDEVWLWASNLGIYEKIIRLHWGTSTGYILTLSLPPRVGMMSLAPGFMIRNGLVVSAWAALYQGSFVNIAGYVNRITN